MNYVVVLPIPVDIADYYNQTQILLIEKQKPEWIAGFYNLVGGKIEEGESPEQSAIRELKEESGLSPIGEDEFPIQNYPEGFIKKPVNFMGVLDTSKGKVYCFNIHVFFTQQLQQDAGETEQVSWHDWNMLDKDKIFPNLKVAIPLMLANISGWTVVDNTIGGSFDKLKLSVIFE